MKIREKMNEFDERFNIIVIELTSLDKDYNNKYVALKVMRAFKRMRPEYHNHVRVKRSE